MVARIGDWGIHDDILAIFYRASDTYENDPSEDTYDNDPSEDSYNNDLVEDMEPVDYENLLGKDACSDEDKHLSEDAKSHA